MSPIFARLLILNAIALGALGSVLASGLASPLLSVLSVSPELALTYRGLAAPLVPVSIIIIAFTLQIIVPRLPPRDRRTVRSLAIQGLIFVSGFLLLVFIPDFFHKPTMAPEVSGPFRTEAVGYVILVIILLGLVGAALSYYLNRPSQSINVSGSDDFRQSSSLILQQLQEIRRTTTGTADIRADLAALHKEIKDFGAARATDIASEDRATIVQSVVRKIDETITDEFIRGIDAKYSSAIQKSAEAKGLIDQFEKLQGRLAQAIGYLEQRANVNLIIGILTTLAAIAGLYYVVFVGLKPAFDGPQDVLVHYIPRISFVVFIEIFSYFFLRLYKANVEDVKYYHNELTNVDSKLIALRATVFIDDPAAIKGMVTTLGKTERNYVLKRGETTTEIERVKRESKSTTDSLSKILQIFKTTNK